MIEPSNDKFIKEYLDELDRVFSYLDATEEEIKNTNIDKWYGSFLNTYIGIGFNKAMLHMKDADKYYFRFIDYLDEEYDDPDIYNIDNDDYEYIQDNLDVKIEKGNLYFWDNKESFIICHSYWQFFKGFVDMSEFKTYLQKNDVIFNAIKTQKLREKFGEVVAYVSKEKQSQ